MTPGKMKVDRAKDRADSMAANWSRDGDDLGGGGGGEAVPAPPVLLPGETPADPGGGCGGLTAEAAWTGTEAGVDEVGIKARFK